MSKKFQQKDDPFASREAQKYDRPVVSREFIIDYLQKVDKPMRLEEILAAFQIEDEEAQMAVKRRLRAMERDGQITRGRGKRFALIKQMELIRGHVIGKKDGFGFFVPEEGDTDIYLSPSQMRKVFPDDVVSVRVIGEDRRGRPEGTIVEVLERKTHQLVGRYFFEEGVHYLQPERKSITQDIIIHEVSVRNVKPGQYVVARITSQPTDRRPAQGEITEVLGDRMEAGMETEVAIRAHALRYEWPEGMEAELAKSPRSVSEAELKGRKDLRKVPFVTIDGIDAKDFDDAVYCEPSEKGGWNLYVAIADVSHYVTPNSICDREAVQRGNSVYFADRVLPMLPEALSNEMCSLKPEVDRLTMVCQMHINKDGKMDHYDFYLAVICSFARLTYSEVARILEKQTTTHARYSQLLELHRVYKALHKQRALRGALDFETTETRIIFDDKGKISQIVPVQRNDAHKIIEECMLQANVATAQYLAKHKMPVLYRVHEGPTFEKLEKLRDFLRALGLRLTGGDDPTSQDYAKLLDRIEGREDKHLISTVLLRSLSQAFYTPSNTGHFGLAYDEYCHFTSPIRRYPDLLVHRALCHVIQKKPADKFMYTHAQFVELGAQCSLTERRADYATRDVIDSLKCQFLFDKVGNIYPGTIVDITNFGIFVELQDIYVQGLLHITALQNDYYQYDATHHRLVGQRTGKNYRLGDTIRVLVARVSVDDRQIDFVLEPQEVDKTSQPKAKSKPRKKKRGKS
ncbi:MAG: ribonuclease R [Pseudomonadota bacterium]|nr:ribonuclease R [Pseudomonadota bacterium]